MAAVPFLFECHPIVRLLDVGQLLAAELFEDGLEGFALAGLGEGSRYSPHVRLRDGLLLRSGGRVGRGLLSSRIGLDLGFGLRLGIGLGIGLGVRLSGRGGVRLLLGRLLRRGGRSVLSGRLAEQLGERLVQGLLVGVEGDFDLDLCHCVFPP